MLKQCHGDQLQCSFRAHWWSTESAAISPWRGYNHCKHRAPSIPPRHMHSHYLASIYSPQSVFNQSLFVNGNRGAPKGRWRGNKWRIFSLLNGALEGLWLGVVGYKSQWFGCTHVLVHWLMGWQLCCLGVVLGHVSGHALRCSFGTGALSGPTGGRFRKKPSPKWRPAPLDQSEWYKTVNGGGNVKHLAVHCCLGDCVSQFVLCFLFISVLSQVFRLLSQM